MRNESTTFYQAEHGRCKHCAKIKKEHHAALTPHTGSTKSYYQPAPFCYQTPADAEGRIDLAHKYRHLSAKTLNSRARTKLSMHVEYQQREVYRKLLAEGEPTYKERLRRLTGHLFTKQGECKFGESGANLLPGMKEWWDAQNGGKNMTATKERAANDDNEREAA